MYWKQGDWPIEINTFTPTMSLKALTDSVRLVPLSWLPLPQDNLMFCSSLHLVVLTFRGFSDTSAALGHLGLYIYPHLGLEELCSTFVWLS